MEEKESIKISADTLIRSFESVYRMASADDSRPHINAVMLDIWADRIQMSATNGMALARYNEELTTNLKDDDSRHYLLRLSDVLSSINVLKDHIHCAIQIVPGEGELILKGDYTIGGLRTVNDSFPNTDKVIPPTGLAPEFKDNMIGIKADLVITAMECFRSIEYDLSFTVWEFGNERTPITISRNYTRYNSYLVVIVMPAIINKTDRRPDHEIQTTESDDKTQ